MGIDHKELVLVVEEFFKKIKENNVISIGSFDKDKVFIEELVKILLLKNKKVLFVPTTNEQASYIDQLDQKTISLSDKEIDVAIEFVDQIDQYNNFIKKNTKSFIKDKMVSQSAYNLIIVVDKEDKVDLLNKDVYVEISSFAWKRTILKLQNYGVARIVMHKNGDFVKTEIAHYLARLTLDSKISLEDFEYSVRNIPGVLETGLFLGLADSVFIYNEESNKNKISVKKVS